MSEKLEDRWPKRWHCVEARDNEFAEQSGPGKPILAVRNGVNIGTVDLCPKCYETFDHHATPAQPPFTQCQRVRTKDGRVLDVSRCEKRVVHGKLRWVVDDLNGERAFADDCELFEGVQPEVRYACTKLAVVGDTVQIAGPNLRQTLNYGTLIVENVEEQYWVSARDSHGTLRRIAAGQLEFVPEAGLVEEVTKMPHVKFPAQTMGDGTQAGTLSVFARGWNGCLQTIRALNPDVQFEEACLDESRKFHLDLGLADRMQARAEKAEAKCEELEKRLNAEDVAHGNTIDHRDTHEASINAICAALGMEEYDASWTSHNNPPERAIEYIEALQGEAEQLTIAKLLLGQCDNRLFLVSDFEIRKAAGGWKLCHPLHGSLVGNDLKAAVYVDPVKAAQRANELSQRSPR